MIATVFRRVCWRRVVLCLLACVLASHAAAGDFKGSGSTFVYPIMLKWAAHWHGDTAVKLSYQGIGSGAGIQQVKSGTVAFGASDKPLSTDELKAAGLAQFPLVIGGVVPVVNLQGIKSGQLNFTGEVLAEIYLGKIKKWNDPAIVALNPHLKLPDLAISVTYRADSSGSTYNWANYLSKYSAEWKAKVGAGTTIKWPTGSGASGNEGMARGVTYIAGAIGYVELSYAMDRKMTVAKLRNRSGNLVAPSFQSFQAAAASASWDAPDFYEVLTDAPGEASWPITATVFVLMPRSSKDVEQSAEALRFFRWALQHGQADARKLDYAALPDELVKRIESYWAGNIR